MKALRRKIIFFVAIFCCLAGAAFYFIIKIKKPPQVLESADVLITNAAVVTMDAKLDVYSPGWVAITGSKISGLGSGQPPTNIIAKKTVDASGKIAMPGLINTHSHSAMALLTGLDQNQPLAPWLVESSAYESKLTAPDVYWGSLLAEDKMLQSGTTAFNDMYFFTSSTAQSLLQSGMRAVLRIPTDMANGQVTYDQNFVAANQNNPLVSFSLAPNPLLDYTPAELKQISDYALAHNYLVHIHFEEDPSARQDALAKYQQTPMQLIEGAGLLRNKIVLAHAVDLTAGEINQLSQHPNAGISFNPLSEYNLQTPLTPAPQMLDAGITVALGTDGEPSSNLDMFAQMRFAAQQESLKPQQLLEMATINGAKILGLDQNIGSLESGKQADIILVNQNSGQDIYSSLVYNTNGSDVTDVWVAGKPLVQNKKVLTIDESQLFEQVSEIKQEIK